MTDDGTRMTLIERLRNPAWENPNREENARLNIKQTREAMEEAAAEIERLTEQHT